MGLVKQPHIETNGGMKMKKALCTILMICILHTTVLAASVSIDYNHEDCCLRVSGEANNGNKIITCEVISISADEEEIDEKINIKWNDTDNKQNEYEKVLNFDYFDQTRGDRDGKFSFSFKCAEGGFYSARILDETSDSVIYSGNIRCYGENEIKNALTIINNSTTYNSFMSNLNSYRDVLGINSSVIDSYENSKRKTLAYGLLFGARPYANVEEMNSQILNSDIVSSFKYASNAEEAYNIAVNNEEVFGLDNNSAYDIFSSDTLFFDKLRKSVINELLEKNDSEFYAKGAFAKLFADSVITNACYKAQWTIVKSVLDNAKPLENYDMSLYNAQKDKSDLCKYINQKKYATISELVNEINSYIRGLSNNNTSPASGGGGGTGSGSNTFISPSDLVDNSVLPQNNNENVFSDMDACEWAREAVTQLYVMGIINGREKNKFEPNDIVKREEFAKMIFFALKLSEEKGDVSFDDIDENAWYAPYVKAIVSTGVMSGIGDGKFGVGKNLIRQDMALIIYKAIKMDNISEIHGRFSDEDAISDYAKNAVLSLADMGTINGMNDGTFSPKTSVTRAQAAKIIYDVIKAGRLR